MQLSENEVEVLKKKYTYTYIYSLFGVIKKMSIAYEEELMFPLFRKLCTFLIINTINVAFI